MTFISVLNDHTFYHFAFAITFKKNLHMNAAKVDFYFIFAKIGIPATFASNLKKTLNLRFVKDRHTYGKKVALNDCIAFIKE